MVHIQKKQLCHKRLIKLFLTVHKQELPSTDLYISANVIRTNMTADYVNNWNKRLKNKI